MAAARKQNRSARFGQVAVAGIATVSILHADRIWGQEGDLSASLTVSPGLETINETGPARSSRDEGTRVITNLDFELLSVTRSQTLTFGLNTNLEYNLSDQDGLEFEDTQVQLGYQLQGKSSEYEVRTNYRRSEIDDSIIGTTIDEDIIVGTGLREDIGFNTSLKLGTNAPLSFGLDYSYRQSEFSETVGTSPNDSETHRVGMQLTFRISPVLSSDLSYSRRERDEDGPGGRDSERDEVQLGTTYKVSRTTQLQAGISYNDNSSTSASGNRSNSGPGYFLGMTHDRPNGQINASYDSNETINGTREQFSFGRSFVLPRAEVSLSLGATRLDSGDFEPIVNAGLDFNIDRNSRIGLSLNQSPAVSNDDNASIRTRFSANYTRELSSVSSLSVGIQFAGRDESGVGAVDENQTQFNLQYRHELDRNWELVSGISFSTTRQNGAQDRETSRLLVGLERRFDLLP